MSESEKPKKSIKSQRKIARASKKHTQKLLFVQISTKPRIWQTSKAQKLSQLPTINPQTKPKISPILYTTSNKSRQKSNKML